MTAPDDFERLNGEEHPDGYGATFDPTSANRILTEALQERFRQHSLGYTVEHDREHGVGHLMQEAHHHLNHMGEAPGPATVREETLQAIALLVAAIEVIDFENPDLVLVDPPIHEEEDFRSGKHFDYGPEFRPGDSVEFMGAVMETCPDCIFPRPLRHDGPHITAPVEIEVPEESQPDE